MELGYLLYALFVCALLVVAVGGVILFLIGILRKQKNNPLTWVGGIGTVVFGLLFMVLDSPGPGEVTSEIHGKYKFTYPSGQVEVLTMKDHVYSQMFYLNEGDYSVNKILHSNNGTWWTEDKAINFEHWLSICDMLDPKALLPEPEISTMRGLSWYPASFNHAASINVFYENGYVLEKID